LFPLLAKVQQWFQASQQRSRRGVPFEVACPCGYLLHGFRQAKHQVARCGVCGKSVFILPSSPLPPVKAPASSESSIHSLPSLAPPKRRRRHQAIVGLLAVILALMLLNTLLFAPFSPFRPQNPEAAVPKSEPDQLHQRLAAGLRALDEGNFDFAAQELEAAKTLRERLPGVLSPDDSRKLTVFHREAVLLADLLTEPLEDVLRHLDGQPDQAVQSTFSRRYQRKGVVFYAKVRRDAAGRYEMDYRLFGARQEARLELADLKLFERLPLQDRRQLLFGVRLAGIQREPNGVWVLKLDPESGVLITHPGAAAACCFQPPDLDVFQETLQQQAAWVAEMP
jgi:hypothetical protein